MYFVLIKLTLSNDSLENLVLNTVKEGKFTYWIVQIGICRDVSAPHEDEKRK